MLDNLLTQKKRSILDRWRQLILDTYPEETVPFLKNDRNRFSNPVGYTINHDLGALFEELVEGMGRPEIDLPRINALIETFVKIRSVQDFTPSQAVGFVHQLKQALRESLEEALQDGDLCRELLAFESRLDEVALLAFEAYMRARERLFEIRARQIRAGTARLLDRVNDSLGNHQLDEDRHESET